MIPKNIHYVWLSGEEMPELNRKCVEKWEYVLPDYTIRKWTAQDFNLDAIPFVQEAIQEKKWAFATDCLRAEILFREGGIYLDSDVWLYDSFDPLLDNRFFSFIEYHHDSTSATAKLLRFSFIPLIFSKLFPTLLPQACQAIRLPSTN